MSYRAIITSSFETDLDNALSYISHKLLNHYAAAKLISNVEKTVSIIAESPFAFPIYHSDKREYHFITVGNYMIFYRADDIEKTVYISRFLYSGQNIREIL